MIFRVILFALATAAVIGGLAYWLKCLCLCDYEMLVTIRSAIVVRSLVRGIIVGKAKRKPRPSMPDWFWWGQDGCWFCKQRNNCNQCKANREYVKEFGEKKQKGRHASAKRGARTKLQLMEDDYGFVEGI